MKNNSLEVWLRGPIDDIPALLQPVAHALLQAKEEVNLLMADFPNRLLGEKPAGMASPGFHLKHMVGVLDRLFTYADGKSLTADQLDYLKTEEFVGDAISPGLAEAFSEAVSKALARLSMVNQDSLLEVRGVGRAQVPSTVLGLLFHAAEHTQRHLGQLIVTVKVLRGQRDKSSNV